MFIENSRFQPAELINLKLVNGDEIVGRLVNIENGRYTMNRPCIVITTSEGLGVLQAMFGLDPDAENLVYKEEHIVTMCHTHPKMAEHYTAVLDKDEKEMQSRNQSTVESD